MMKLLSQKLWRGALLLTLFFTVSSSWGQLASWNPNGLSWGPATPTWPAASTAANSTITGFVRGSGLGTSGAAAASSYGGSGVSGSATKQEAIDEGRYFTFTAKANTGYTMSVTGISSWFTRKSSGNVTVALQYSINGGSYTDIGSTDITSTSGTGSASAIAFSTVVQAALANLPATSTVTFRFLVYGTSANVYLVIGTQGTRFQLDGTVAAATPTVTTTAATTLTASSAKLNGTVNPNSTTVGITPSFEWGTTIAYTGGSVSAGTALTGTSATAISATLSSLSANTLYHYRAVGTVGTTAYNGGNLTFYTLANVPAALVVSNEQLNSLDIAVNDTDNNPAATQYAIKISGGTLTGTQYLNATGGWSTTVTWRTAAQWAATAAKTVNGLTQSTTYTFAVKARNNAATPVETAFSGNASGTTLTPSTPFISLVSSDLNFDEICINSTSTGSFVISGTNLSGQDVHITATASGAYTYSFTGEEGSYSDDNDIMGYDGTQKTIYVRFSPQAVQSYNENILLTATGIETLYVAILGSGIDNPGTATTAVATTITSTSAVLNGSAASGVCTAITGYGIEYSTTNNFVLGTGTQLSSTDLNNAGGFSFPVTGLLPNTAYYFRAYVTDGSTVNNGIHYGSQLSFTTSSLAAPVTTAATAVGQYGFTANWNAVAGATGYRLDVSTNPAFGTAIYASDLIISEYVEGTTGNNRAIEIYNGTGAAVNLSAYSLKQDVTGTGNSFGSDLSYDLPLPNVSLSAGDTYVIAASDATAIQAAVPAGTIDMSISYNASVQGGRVVFFTGNDAMALYKNNVQIDFIPGGTDVTLVRKATVMAPATTYNANEWTTSSGVYTDIGSHTMNTSFTPSFVSGYNNLDVNNVTTYNVTGLEANTAYYYRVRAYSANSTSGNSNVTGVTTQHDTVVWQIPAGESVASWLPSVPDVTMNTIINANYTTGTNGAFTAKSLTLNAGKTFHVTTGTTITVQNAIVNNAAVENFVVEDNAALIQTAAVANTNPVTVLKNSNPLFRLDYTMWSSPVAGQNLFSFSPLTSITRFYEYKYDTDPVSGLDVEQYFGIFDAPGTPNTTANTTFATAKGYLIRMPNTNTTEGYNTGGTAITYTGEFKGVLNNGTKTYPLSTIGDHYTAVGNPYPSPISVNEFIDQNESVIDGTLYFYRKRNASSTSTYATITKAAYTANVAGGGNINNDYYTGDNVTNGTWRIAQGQGFIVHTASGAANPQLQFTNTMRKAVIASGQAFFKSAPSTMSRLWLNITDGNNGFCQTAVAYINDATLGFDYGYDGKHFSDANTLALYSLAGENNLAIQARPAFEATDVVPMGFVTNIAGQYTISLDHFDGLFSSGQNIYIKDNVEGLTHSLKNGDYTFTSEAGTFTNRFEVVYTTDALGTNNPVLSANSVIVYKQGDAININSGTAIMTGVTIYDIRGRKLYSQSNINANQTAINGLQVQNEVLIVEIITMKGKISKKIVF